MVGGSQPTKVSERRTQDGQEWDRRCKWELVIRPGTFATGKVLRHRGAGR